MVFTIKGIDLLQICLVLVRVLEGRRLIQPTIIRKRLDGNVNRFLVAILEQGVIYLFQYGCDDLSCLVTISLFEINLFRVPIEGSQALVFDGEAVASVG